MSTTVCTRPECQTLAGCQCQRADRRFVVSSVSWPPHNDPRIASLEAALAEARRDCLRLRIDNDCLSALLAEKDAALESFRAAVETVVQTFERDEAQGYHTRDRQFAISILRKALEEYDRTRAALRLATEGADAK